MIISGLNSNSIYPQNQATWSLNLTTAQDLSGKYFSLYSSGNNNLLEILKLKNNKIYDKDNYLIGNYSNDTKINFSGKISENKYTLYQNNVLLFDGKDKTGFNFDSFIFNTNGSFVDVENLSIWGVRPKFYINGFTSSNFAIQTQNNQTAPILNYSYLDNSIPLDIYNGGSSPIYIYSGVSKNTDFYIPLLTPIIIPPYTTVSGISNNTEFPISVPAPIIIPPYTTGIVNIINSSFVFGQSTIPIILYSNAGNINLNLQVSGAKAEEGVYYFSFGPKITYINNKTSQNYNLTFFNKQNPVNLNIELNYISGITGAIYKEIEHSNLYTELKQVSGFISGVGYLYSDVVTGIVQNFNSLTDELNGVPYYYNKLETGLGSGIFSKYKIAEDQNLYYTYEIYASGYGNGILLTSISSTGLQQITYSGYLTYLGGYLTGEACGSTTGLIPNAKRGWTYNEQGKFVPPVLKENIFALVCKYRPELSICKQAVNIYNYEYAVGNICGRSIIYMPYTGQIKAEYPDTDLISIDLISPFLTVTGNFQGFLDIFGIALATGDRISGVAIGDFAKDIEPGFYNFYKNWSGILTGKSFLNWTGADFNPVSAESTNYSTFNVNSNFLQLSNVSDSLSVLSGFGKETTTGFFVGKISESGILELCSPMLPDAIRVIGTPSVIGSVGDQNPNIVYTGQKQAFIVMPNSYFEEIKYENSQYLLSGFDAHLYYGYPSGGRTRISRLGNTSNGSGKFDNVFQLPNFSGFSYQKTDENGNLLFKLKLDSNGNPIPKYATTYECMPLTGANGSPVTGENGELITGADGNFVPQPLVINGSPILKQKTDSNGNAMFDSSGFPILDYTCQPLLGANGQPIFLPILDANGDQVFEQVPDLESISKDFVGWSETLFVNTGIAYSNATPPSIKDIDINCYLFDPCDISIINFKIDKPNFFYSSAEELVNQCFEGCFENWPKQISENITSGIIFGYDSFTSATAAPNNLIKINICDNEGLKYFKFNEGDGAPVNLKATNITLNSMNITWDTVIGATSYCLDVSTENSFASFVAGYSNKTVNGRSDSITGLTAGTVYYVRVRAVLPGRATSVNSLVLTQGIPLEAPNQPTISNVTSSSFTATWDSVTGASTYRLDVSTVSNFATRVTGYDNLAVNGTSQSITGLMGGTVYYVRIRAVGAAGTSPNSETITQITVTVAPNQPTISKVTTSSFTATWVTVTGASTYRLDVSTVSNFATRVTGYDDLAVNGTSQSITGLMGGTVYYVRIRAVNAAGTSSNSEEITQITAPVAPSQLVSSNITSSSFIVAWSSVTGASTYRLDVSTASNFATRVTGYDNLAVNGTSQSITGLMGGTVYYVRIRAVGAAGTSPNSETLAPITGLVAPNQPIISFPDSSSFTAQWNAIGGASGYEVDVAINSNFTSGFVLNYKNTFIRTPSISTVVIGLTSGITYYVRVRAVSFVNGKEVRSEYSPTAEQIMLAEVPKTPTATSITLSSFTANWNSATAATNYRLDVSTAYNFATRVAGYDDLIVNGTSQPITGLTAGTVYYVRVRAFSAAGASKNSGTLVQVTIPVAPNQPTIAGVTSSSFIANWNIVTGASSYRVDVATTSDFTSGFVANYNDKGIGSTGISVTGLTAGTTYYVRVRAVSQKGGLEVTSINSANTAQMTLASTTNTPTATSITLSSFTANWNSATAATNYRLDVSTDNFATRVAGYDDLIVNGTSQPITGLTAGTVYYVRVRTVNAAGTSPNSGTLVQVTIPVAPNQPTITSVTSSSFIANWNIVTGASSYRVDVATTSDFTSGFVANYNDKDVFANTNVTVTGLISATRYYLRVRAVNTLTGNALTSVNSINAEQVLLPFAPNIPTATAITDNGFTANWTNPGGALTYRLDVSTVYTFATRLNGYDNLTVNSTSQQITGLTDLTVYYVRVRAINSAGLASSPSPFLTQMTHTSILFGEGYDAAWYGTSVATNSNGTVLVMGGPEASVNTFLDGATVIYTGDPNGKWLRQQTLTPPSQGQIKYYNDNNLNIGRITSYTAEFGTSSAISSNGDIIILGGPGASIDGYRDKGAAAVFYRNSNTSPLWDFKQFLAIYSYGMTPSYAFGTSVASNSLGSVFIVGAPLVESAYVYTGNPTNGWNLKQTLTNAAKNSSYGENVAINNDASVLIVGARYASAAYVYTGTAINGWGLRQTLTGDSAFNYFGRTIAINSHGTILAVTSPSSIYIYTGTAINGWTLCQKITDQQWPLLPELDKAKMTLAINSDGTSIAVRTPSNRFDFNGTGTVDLFTGNSISKWQRKHTFSGDTATRYDSFGTSIALNSGAEILMVGDPYVRGYGRVYTL